MSFIEKYEKGDWRIEELLGEGSFGQVYKIVKEELGYKYYAALKVIPVPRTGSELVSLRSEGYDEASLRTYMDEKVESIMKEVRFVREFEGTSNIVSYQDHEIQMKDGEPGYIILLRMELLKSLEKVALERELGEDETVKIGIDICRALELLAKNGTIHRDVKPENIFLSKHGDYKLGDFGIARQIERALTAGTRAGSPNYMAPEVYSGKLYGATVDLYSLGLVMHRLLNNKKLPFISASSKSLSQTERDEALGKRMTGVQIPEPANASPGLSKVILKACEFNAKNRYKTASEMRVALETYKNQAAIKPLNIRKRLIHLIQPYISSTSVSKGEVSRPPFFVSNAENIGNNFEGMIRVSDQWLTNSNGVAKLTPNDSFDPSYIFRFELRLDGTYRVISKKDGKCLDVNGGTSNQGCKVQFYASNDSDAQRIRFENFKEGYAIGVKCSPNNVIDAGGEQGNFGDGTRLWMWGRNDSGPQWFQIFRDETRSFNGKQIVIKSVAANKYVTVWDDTARSAFACMGEYSKSNGSGLLTVKVADDGWAGLFSSCAGKYLTTNINKNEAPLEAAATSMQSWEVYKFYKSWDVYYLKSQANGKWVSAVLNQSNVPLKARSDYPDFWEKCKIEEPVKGIAEGTYRIINGSGRSLSVLTGSNTANLTEEDANDQEYEVEVLKESDQVYIELNHVPTRGYRDGIIEGSVLSNEGFDTSTLAIITVIETDEGLYFPKPSMDNPITKIRNNQFTSRFYTDQETDFQVPSILLFVVDKSYTPDMQIKAGQDWALSQVTIDAFKAVSMAAIKINRF